LLLTKGITLVGWATPAILRGYTARSAPGCRVPQLPQATASAPASTAHQL